MLCSVDTGRLVLSQFACLSRLQPYSAQLLWSSPDGSSSSNSQAAKLQGESTAMLEKKFFACASG